ncbi:MAG: hypothetical protein MJ252_29070 [archaeon]|nr:hypothetical protein [archaeon]
MSQKKKLIRSILKKKKIIVKRINIMEAHLILTAILTMEIKRKKIIKEEKEEEKEKIKIQKMSK